MKNKNVIWQSINSSIKATFSFPFGLLVAGLLLLKLCIFALLSFTLGVLVCKTFASVSLISKLFDFIVNGCDLILNGLLTSLVCAYQIGSVIEEKSILSSLKIPFERFRDLIKYGIITTGLSVPPVFFAGLIYYLLIEGFFCFVLSAAVFLISYYYFMQYTLLAFPVLFHKKDITASSALKFSWRVLRRYPLLLIILSIFTTVSPFVAPVLEKVILEWAHLKQVSTVAISLSVLISIGRFIIGVWFVVFQTRFYYFATRNNDQNNSKDNA